MKSAIERRKEGRKFRYFTNGAEITDEGRLDYLNSIKIPPAWKRVNINARPRSKILATGLDKAGRLQYIYNPVFRQKQEKEKFDRILRFANALPKMRRITTRQLNRKGLSRDKVLALIIRLMDEAYFRVGNQQYARENKSYGITTLRSKHMSIEGDEITFDFTGKSGQRQLKKITDKKLANTLKRLDELPGYEIFKYVDEDGHLVRVKSEDVNQYIKRIMGEEFTAKDFRTWGGTLLASAELAAGKRAANERERKKIITSCVKNVARKLGNTPAIARSSYIDPRIIKSFMDSDELRKVYAAVEKARRSAYVRPEEECVMKLLKKA